MSWRPAIDLRRQRLLSRTRQLDRGADCIVRFSRHPHPPIFPDPAAPRAPRGPAQPPQRRRARRPRPMEEPERRETRSTLLVLTLIIARVHFVQHVDALLTAAAGQLVRPRRWSGLESVRRGRRSDAARRPTVAIVGAGASGMLVADPSAARPPRGADAASRRADRPPPSAAAASPIRRPTPTTASTSPRRGCRRFPTSPTISSTGGRISRRARSGRLRRARRVPPLPGRTLLAAPSARPPPDVTLARLVAEVEAVEPLDDHVRLRLGRRRDARCRRRRARARQPGGDARRSGCAGACGHAAYVHDPWAPGALDALDPAARGRVLLIGTGLTMVDVAMTVTARCPHAQVLAVSRHGLLPRAHLPGRRTAAAPAGFDPGLLPRARRMRSSPSPPPATRLAQACRRSAPGHAGALEAADARGAAASSPPTTARGACTATAWLPEVATMLADLLGSGRLAGQRRLGRARGRHRRRARSTRRLGVSDRLAVALAVNCTGPGLDPRASHDPLVRPTAARRARAAPIRSASASTPLPTAPSARATAPPASACSRSAHRASASSTRPPPSPRSATRRRSSPRRSARRSSATARRFRSPRG